MTRIDINSSELSLLHELVVVHREKVQALVSKDSKLSHLLTRSDGLMEELRAAKLRLDAEK